jgi:uncharacterized membrane protein YidH (DUF202 family)
MARPSSSESRLLDRTSIAFLAAGTAVEAVPLRAAESAHYSIAVLLDALGIGAGAYGFGFFHTRPGSVSA